MEANNAEQLLDALVMAAIAKGRSPESVTIDTVRIWLRLLPDVPISHVERAIEIWSRDAEQRHPPTPADVLALVRRQSGSHWPAADEAWAIALRASDEGATVVWFDELAEAWGVAKTVLDAGDEIGARMAFRESYKRLLAAAQAANRKPRAWVSLGHDLDRREPAITHAVQIGLLTQGQARRYLPRDEISDEGAAIAGLITGNVVAHPTRDSAFREHFEALRAAIKPRSAKAEDPEAEAEAQRRRAAAAAWLKGQQA